MVKLWISFYEKARTPGLISKVEVSNTEADCIWKYLPSQGIKQTQP